MMKDDDGVCSLVGLGDALDELREETCFLRLGMAIDSDIMCVSVSVGVSMDR